MRSRDEPGTLGLRGDSTERQGFIVGLGRCCSEGREIADRERPFSCAFFPCFSSEHQYMDE